MLKKNILIVDDEEDILKLLNYNLSLEGYNIICSLNGENALRTIKKQAIDLIILDLMLPGINGLEVARKLKENSDTKNIPIIMLSAKGEESDIVSGLELGADDYISKPFSTKILIARVRAVLRRKEQQESQDDQDCVININGLLIHTGKREVRSENQVFDLTYTEFQILCFLTRHPGWVYTRTQIVKAVHGDDYPVTDRSIDVQIVGLRKKLGPWGKYIETVRGVGYKYLESDNT